MYMQCSRADPLGSYECTPSRRVLATSLRPVLTLSHALFTFSFPVGYLETMNEPAQHSQVREGGRGGGREGGREGGRGGGREGGRGGGREGGIERQKEKGEGGTEGGMDGGGGGGKVKEWVGKIYNVQCTIFICTDNGAQECREFPSDLVSGHGRHEEIGGWHLPPGPAVW